MESYKSIILHLRISIVIFILWMFVLLLNCRNTELGSGAPGDPIRGNGLFVSLLIGGGFSGGFGSGGSSGGDRVNLIVAENVVYAFGQSNNSTSIISITSPQSVSRNLYNIPNCTPSFSSSSTSTTTVYCRILTFSASGGQARAIAARIVGVREPNVSEVTTEANFYLGVASTSNLTAMSFTQIDNTAIGLTELTNVNIFRNYESATDGTNFIFSFPASTNQRYCGTNNNGESWSCETPVGFGEQFVRNLSGTLAVGATRRWNGTTFVNTTVTNGFRFVVPIGSRTHFPNTTPQFTDQAPGVWTNPLTTTNGAFTVAPIGNLSGALELNGNVNIVFSQESGSNETFRRTFYVHQSTDNGLNYSLTNTIGAESSSPIGVITRPNTFKSIGLGSTIYAAVEGQDSNNRFQTILVYSTDFTNWTLIQ